MEQALGLLDRFNIQTGLLSVRNPRERVTPALHRAVNELAAKIVSDHPRRFGALAMVPQHDFDAAPAEAVYALDTLRLDGIQLNPSVDNVYLGAPQLDPLLAELNRRSATALVHPTEPFYFEELGLDIRSSIMEYVFETTRAVMNLVVSGSLERYPNIRFIMAHAGGAAPYIAARLDEQGQRFDPRLKERAPKGVLYYLKTLYYSTAQATSNYSLSALLKLVDSSRVLFGTDLPISPPSLIRDSDAILRAFPGITAPDLERIERGNARRLFPRIARLA